MKTSNQPRLPGNLLGIATAAALLGLSAIAAPALAQSTIGNPSPTNQSPTPVTQPGGTTNRINRPANDTNLNQPIQNDTTNRSNSPFSTPVNSGPTNQSPTPITQPGGTTNRINRPANDTNLNQPIQNDTINRSNSNSVEQTGGSSTQIDQTNQNRTIQQQRTIQTSPANSSEPANTTAPESTQFNSQEGVRALW